MSSEVVAILVSALAIGVAVIIAVIKTARETASQISATEARLELGHEHTLERIAGMEHRFTEELKAGSARMTRADSRVEDLRKDLQSDITLLQVDVARLITKAGLDVRKSTP